MSSSSVQYIILYENRYDKQAFGPYNTVSAAEVGVAELKEDDSEDAENDDSFNSHVYTILPLIPR